MRNFEVNEDMRRYFESLFNIEKEMNKNTEDILNDNTESKPLTFFTGSYLKRITRKNK